MGYFFLSFRLALREKAYASSFLPFFLEIFASEYLVRLILVLTKEMRTSGALFFSRSDHIPNFSAFVISFIERSCGLAFLFCGVFFSALGQKQRPNDGVIY